MATTQQQQQQAEAQTRTPHVVILPSPGMGHLIPLTEFAKRLVHLHGFSVTFLVPTTNGPPSAAMKSVLAALPAAIDHSFLPPISFTDPSLRGETVISLTVTQSLPAIRAALNSLSVIPNRRLTALVADLFATDALDAAEEFGAAPYVFYPSTAMALSLFLRLPELDAAVSGEFRDSPDPIRIPGCVPIKGSDLLDPLQDRKDAAYGWVMHHGKRYREAEGIIVNSFPGVEPGALKALQEDNNINIPVYPVGPLVKSDPTESGTAQESDPCLKWLDGQPPGSVVFVSFGSGGTLTSAQLTELALGLEMSEQRFLWVARSPSDKSASATYFDPESVEDPFHFLPDGFVGRTSGRGLVVPSWAPQVEVLAHGSTGGFLTHCGWNSVLESVVYGVPLIAWPLYAEQKMNAVLLAEDLRAALRPAAATEDGMVGRGEIARVVKGLMEGEEGKGVRNRMKDLKDAAARVLSEDGSSNSSLAELARKWKKTHKAS